MAGFNSLHWFAWHLAVGHLGLHKILSEYGYEAVQGYSTCPLT